MRLLAPLLLCVGFSLPGPTILAEEPVAYTNPQLLVEPAALQSHFDGKKPLSSKLVVLLDVRPLADYRQGTLPGAQHLDVQKWKGAFGKGDNPKRWGKLLGQVLPSEQPTVVLVDRAMTDNAARMWWILRYWGVEDVRLLNGGTQAWQGKWGDPPAPHEPVVIKVTPQPQRLTTMAELEAILAAPEKPETSDLTLIDARSAGEVAQGMIPTAKNLDFRELIDPKSGRMRSAKELKQRLALLGFDPQQPTIVYCRSGGRASIVVLAAELMGSENVSNYYRSWGEWSQAKH